MRDFAVGAGFFAEVAVCGGGGWLKRRQNDFLDTGKQNSAPFFSSFHAPKNGVIPPVFKGRAIW